MFLFFLLTISLKSFPIAILFFFFHPFKGWTDKSVFRIFHEFPSKGVYIKHVGGGPEGFIVFTVIFKFRITKEVNTHNDIQKIMLK